MPQIVTNLGFSLYNDYNQNTYDNGNTKNFSKMFRPMLD